MKSLFNNLVKVMNVKVIMMIAICSIATLAAKAQEQPATTAAVTTPEVADPNKKDACFPGGMSGFYAYIASQVKLDSSCIPGRKVYITFMIDKKGKLRKAKVNEHVLSEKMNAQLVKIFESAPDWEPAKQNGHDLKEHFICPVVFMPKVDLIAANTVVKK